MRPKCMHMYAKPYIYLVYAFNNFKSSPSQGKFRYMGCWICVPPLTSAPAVFGYLSNNESQFALNLPASP